MNQTSENLLNKRSPMSQTSGRAGIFKPFKRLPGCLLTTLTYKPLTRRSVTEGNPSPWMTIMESMY